MATAGNVSLGESSSRQRKGHLVRRKPISEEMGYPISLVSSVVTSAIYFLETSNMPLFLSEYRVPISDIRIEAACFE